MLSACHVSGDGGQLTTLQKHLCDLVLCVELPVILLSLPIGWLLMLLERTIWLQLTKWRWVPFLASILTTVIRFLLLSNAFYNSFSFHCDTHKEIRTLLRIHALILMNIYLIRVTCLCSYSSSSYACLHSYIILDIIIYKGMANVHLERPVFTLIWG